MDHPYTNLPFIVVSGIGRSGTTVLRNCVAAHSDIDSLNQESNYLFSIMREANLASENRSLMQAMSFDVATFWKKHRQFVLDFFWPDPRPQSDAPQAISTYWRLDPRAAMGLADSFPQLSICSIVRNGVEVVSSYQSFDAFKDIPFEKTCEIWAFGYLMTQYCRDNDHATLIRYEWLDSKSGEFQNALAECFAKVGLVFDPNCLAPLSENFHPTKVKGESRNDSNDRSKRKDRWKYWTSQQRKSFTTICGEAMDGLGYPIPWDA